MEKISEMGGWYDAERNAAGKWMESRSNGVCDGCGLNKICDMPPEQYQKEIGLDELTQITDTPTDPLFYQEVRRVRPEVTA